MNQDVECATEEVAFSMLQKTTPELLKLIRSLVGKGLTSDEIVEILVESLGQPPHRDVFTLAGCAADYLINNPDPATKILQ